MSLPFDPDETARQFGDEYLIPPPVRRLADAEVHTMFPDEFHAIRGRERCGCGTNPTTRAVLRRRGALGGIDL